MKQIFLWVMGFCFLTTSCEQLKGYFVAEKGHAAKADSATIEAPVVRNTSITEANAYNSLFLDSVQMEAFFRRQQINDTLAQKIRNFYNQRNYQFAWLAPHGLTEQARGFWNLYGYAQGTDSARRLTDTTFYRSMDSLLHEDSLQLAAADTGFVRTELLLTQHFLNFRQQTDSSLINDAALRALLPVKKITALEMAGSLLHQTDSSYWGEANRPLARMKEQVQRYYTLVKEGGWQPVPLLGAQQLKKGASSPVVTAIKKRLQKTGEYTAGDTSSTFTDALVTALKKYQKRNGFDTTGIITDSLIQVLNIPAEKRLQQILLNMNRMLWMPAFNSNNRIEVNIPAFMLYVWEDTQRVLEMPVVVGKQGTHTTLFSDSLTHLVFSPAWNIPRSIVETEILPALKTDPDYLKKNNMEMVQKGGGIPQIRQLPGPNNALGKVKFMFPNSYDIYLHDTPHKNLFAQDNRAFSHGCIRVAHAQKLAEYLLRNQPEWTTEKIKAAMNSGKEQTVHLKQPVPVLITYFTAWVDEVGELNFRNDVYGHDEQALAMLFRPINGLQQTASPAADSL